MLQLEIWFVSSYSYSEDTSKVQLLEKLSANDEINNKKSVSYFLLEVFDADNGMLESAFL